MDYIKQTLYFKIRKVIRYAGIYGFARTIVKVRSQYHFQEALSFEGDRWTNPACADADNPQRNVAIVGCGKYSFSCIAYYAKEYRVNFLRYAYDPNRNRARSLCKAYNGAHAVSEWRDILSDPAVKMVFIASNHASHTEYAIDCINAGKHVHIEKPHVISQDQLDRLVTAMRQNPSVKVFLGFNRPRSPLFRRLRALLDSQTGPSMINWFIAGHQIADDHWYFKESEGGRILGNLCHWSDLTLQLVGMEAVFPCDVIPATSMGSKSDFVVSLNFADKSSAAITFSAKGHTFEGVREVLNLHKGDVLANLTDFKSLTADIVERKHLWRSLFRDHGHRMNIVNSLRGLDPDGTEGETLAYVTATARLFLAIREAVDTGATVTVRMDDFAVNNP